MTTPVKTPVDRERVIIRRAMPFIAADSALLPTDKWLFQSLRDIYKTPGPFRRDVRAVGMLAAAVGGLALTVTTGLIALAVVGTVTGLAVAAAGLTAAATAAGAWWQGQKIFQRAKVDTLPLLQQEFGKRYVAFKAEEMMRLWKERIATARAAKEATASGIAAKGALTPSFEAGGKPAVKKDAAPPVKKPPAPPR